MASVTYSDFCYLENDEVEREYTEPEHGGMHVLQACLVTMEHHPGLQHGDEGETQAQEKREQDHGGGHVVTPVTQTRGSLRFTIKNGSNIWV